MASGDETWRIPSSWPIGRGLALAWTAVVLALCLVPSYWFPRPEPTAPHLLIPHLDKLVHGTLFAGFGLLWMWAGPSPRRWVSVLMAGVLIGFATEVLQAFPFIHRDPDFLDGVADLVGTILGIGVSQVGNPLSLPDDRS